MLSAKYFPNTLNTKVVNEILVKIKEIITPQVQAITYAELLAQLEGQDITNIHIYSKMLELKLEIDQAQLDEQIVNFIVPILIYQLDKQLSQCITLSTVNSLLFIVGDGSLFADILQAYQIHPKLFRILQDKANNQQILIGKILILLNYVSDSIYYRKWMIMNNYLYYAVQYLEGQIQDDAANIFWSTKRVIQSDNGHLTQFVSKFNQCLPFFIKYLEKYQDTSFELQDCLEIIIIIANNSLKLIADQNQSIINKLIQMITQFAKNSQNDNLTQLLAFRLINILADKDDILDMIVSQGFFTGLTITCVKRAKLLHILDILLKISGKSINYGKLFLNNNLIQQLFQMAFECNLQVQQLILSIFINLLKKNMYELDVHIYNQGLWKFIRDIFIYSQTENYNIGLQITLLLLQKYAQNKEQYGFVEKTIKQHKIFSCIALLETVGQNGENDSLIKQILQIL